ncbi:hypothetical protein ACHAPJ_012958 [Fusarium lateritium]
MSYFFQRISMGEVFLKCLDQGQPAASTTESNNFYRVQQIDAKIDEFWRSCPAFFRFHNDLTTSNEDKSDGLIMQRYVLNLFVHGQRCRINLPYVARGTVEPIYARSRAACLASARLIIQAEQVLAKDNVPFASTRLRMAVVLHNLFLAFVTLLLDTCLDAAGSGRKANSLDLVFLWKVLQDAKAQSSQAETLLEPLGRVMRKHNIFITTNDVTRHPTTYTDVQENKLTPSEDLNMNTMGGVAEPGFWLQDWLSAEFMFEASSSDWSGLLTGLDLPSL